MSDDAEFIRAVRAAELENREETFREWSFTDMEHARCWRLIERKTGITCRADIARNVRWAREWNWQLVRLKRRRKMQ